MKHLARATILAAILGLAACAGGSAGGDSRSEPAWKDWGLGGRAS